MKVNELRVDNWVEITSDEGNEFIQCNVNTIKMVERGSDFISPIPENQDGTKLPVVYCFGVG